VDTKVTLTEAQMPRQWYNVAADLPRGMQPPLHPATGQPVGPDDLAPIFPMNLIEQEVSPERWIDIPDEVLGILKLWRPTPLYRATRLEKALGTPAKIFYKNEGVSPPGSHKPNTAVAQAYYNKEFGIKRLTTETGAGQWGSALAFAGQHFGLEIKVFMVRVSFEQKPYRRLLMQTWGGECIPSPSERTAAGRGVLARFPDTPGSLGIAISEAVEVAAQDPHTKYSLGSVLNHVMLHQTVIGQEALRQLELAEERADVIIGCVGGGSNFAGLALPFIQRKIDGEQVRVVAVEPNSCPTLTRGPYAYDFGDTACTTPLLAMHTLGHDFVPAPIHAGGLRYHGVSPIVSQLVLDGLAEPLALPQTRTFAAGLTFARTEGVVPAPETCHAVAAAIDEAERAREEGQERVIVFSFSGHGLLDLAAYEAYLAGELGEHALPEEDIERALETTASLPRPARAN